MGEPTNFVFDLKEVGEMLIAKQGITQGKWAVGLEFQFTAGTMGISPDQSQPGWMILVNRITLTKHPAGAPETAYVVDAAKVKK